jgi:hypothetical protein
MEHGYPLLHTLKAFANSSPDQTLKALADRKTVATPSELATYSQGFKANPGLKLANKANPGLKLANNFSVPFSTLTGHATQPRLIRVATNCIPIVHAANELMVDDPSSVPLFPSSD